MDIVLADPNMEVRSALRCAIEEMPGLRVTGEASDVLDLLMQASHACPDVILLDPEIIRPAASRKRLAPGRLPEMVHLLRCFCPQARIIVISSRLPAESIEASAAVDGMLSKTDPPETLWRILYGKDPPLSQC